MLIYQRVSVIIYELNTARTGVLPGEVCGLTAQGRVFFAFWDVSGLPKWLTRFVSKTQNLKLQTRHHKP